MGDAAYVPLDALTRMVRPDLRPLQGVAERGVLGSDAALEPAPLREGVSLIMARCPRYRSTISNAGRVFGGRKFLKGRPTARPLRCSACCSTGGVTIWNSPRNPRRKRIWKRLTSI